MLLKDEHVLNQVLLRAKLTNLTIQHLLDFVVSLIKNLNRLELIEKSFEQRLSDVLKIISGYLSIWKDFYGLPKKNLE
jgi:hypothetical protein